MLVLNLQDGSRVWINLSQIVKMVKRNGEYYLYLSNGDSYQIDHGTASWVENYFE